MEVSRCYSYFIVALLKIFYPGNLGPMVQAIEHSDQAELARRLRSQRTNGLFLVAHRPYHDPSQHHDLGHMDVACPSCSALHWMVEKLTDSSQ